jgi:TolA-binding protein
MRKLLLLLVLLAVSFSGFAQEAGTEHFAPFISKLKAKVDESQVLITWRNPNNLEGTILLYRHSNEIIPDNLADAALIARLGADQESYRDSPPDDTPYYYAVLIEDSSGTAQNLFVPFRNKTSRAVRISVPPPVKDAAARITGIQATVSDDSVQIVFQTSNPNRELLLFRGNSAMTSTENLLEAFTPLQLDAGTTRYVDYPIPGVESYYAVVDTEMFKLGKQVLVAGENTTDQGVMVPLEVPRVALRPIPEAKAEGGPEAAAEQPPAEKPTAQPAAFPPASSTQPGQQAIAQALAATPLPYLQLAEEGGSVFSIPRRREDLDPETQAAIARILDSTAPLQAGQTAVVILPEDKDEPATGESAGLYKILQEHLLAGDYTGAETKLQGFLNLRRSAYTEARVRFYLAQAYYFQELYEEALLEFVLAQGQLYAPVQPWLVSCFRLLWE